VLLKTAKTTYADTWCGYSIMHCKSFQLLLLCYWNYSLSLCVCMCTLFL